MEYCPGDEEAFEALRGLELLPFESGRKVAVKVIDHRGNEILEVIIPAETPQ